MKQHSKKQAAKSRAVRKTIKPLYLVIILGIVAAFLALIIIPNFIKNSENDEHIFKKEGELTITDSAGASKVKLDIEIADNDYDRELGLMFRKEMNENRGMLFIFPREEMQAFWMKNTLISLDIIFINAAKEIVTIQRNAEPLNQTSLPSSKPSLYVLEVNGGFSERHGIKEGDKINFYK